MQPTGERKAKASVHRPERAFWAHGNRAATRKSSGGQGLPGILLVLQTSVQRSSATKSGEKEGSKGLPLQIFC